MKPSALKFYFLSRDLAKTQTFYSALGMAWLNGKEVTIGETGLPVHCEDSDYAAQLPHLWGDLGNLEFVFYLESYFNETILKPPLQQTGNSVLLVYYDGENDVRDVVEKLKSEGLFVPVEDHPFSPRIADPDGRVLELCPPSPLRL